MSDKEIILTQEGYNKLEEELSYLRGHKKMEVAERIKIAREFGDISENSEYDEAKNEQGLLEAKIQEIENTLRLAKVIDDKISIKTVNVGLKVKVFDCKYNEEIVYSVVGSSEVDIKLNKISNESPVGKALMGKKKNDEVEVETPSGIAKYKILNIEK